MKRVSGVISGLAMVFAVSGCGDDEGPKPDMAIAGALTGAPCTTNTDCAKGLGANQDPVCLKEPNSSPSPWPGGYCSSPCQMANNQADRGGRNPDCPSENATCWGFDTTGECVTLCNSSSDCRNGGTDYSCFVVNDIALGCLPTANSECDPSVAGSCPSAQQTCVNIGDGTVGACTPACDFFANTGCPGTTEATDCHASDTTGEGLCSGPAPAGVTAGSSCGNFFSDCPGGYGCLDGKCWKYCNDANKDTQCSPGATCERFGPDTPVPTSVAGICSRSS